MPAEYRLFFDAPILKAYQYISRPFNLKLALSPLTQGESLSQVVDRASLTNRISKEGQVLTDARYFVKNRGNTHFRIVLPEKTDLWSATVNGAAVVPVKDGEANLIPLPQMADPNAVLTVDLKLASSSPDATHLKIAAPTVLGAPVMLAEWEMVPDSGRRLIYRARFAGAGWRGGGCLRLCRAGEDVRGRRRGPGENFVPGHGGVGGDRDGGVALGGA